MDVLKAVDERGPVGPRELEAAFDSIAEDEFAQALDAVVDQGLVRMAGGKHSPAGGYRLTRRGRRLLEAFTHARAAA